MTKRTRLFVGIAVGVLVAGLGTGLVASYFGLPAIAQFGSRGPSELEYVPQDARLVAFANVRDVMDSELRRKILELRPDNREPRQGRTGEPNLFQQAGIDVENDVDRVVATLSGGANEADRERPLILARGRFDDDLIETLVRQRGGKVEEYRGKRLLIHSDGEHELGVSFVEPDLVAFGTAAAVRRAIDTEAGASPDVTTNQEVMALVRDIDSGNAWAVGRFDVISGRANLPRELSRQLPPINWFAASGHVNGGVRGLIRAETRDETAAQDLREVLRGFMALARLQAGANPQMRAMMCSLELGGDGRTVSLAFSLAPEVIDALATMHQQRTRPEAPPGPGSAPGPAPEPAPVVPRT
jgi:hypothetical protein